MYELGKIVEIDLSCGRVSRTEISPRLIEKYLGGRGFNVWYLSRHLPDDTEPLSPENIIVSIVPSPEHDLHGHPENHTRFQYFDRLFDQSSKIQIDKLEPIEATERSGTCSKG